MDQGSSGTATVIVNSMINFSSPVGLAVSGLPAGIVAGFGTNPVTPPAGGSASSPLIISVGSSVSAAIYPLIVAGTNGTISHSASLTLKVIGTGDFTITVSPASIIVAPSAISSATVTVASLSSFSSPVSLASTGVPLGLTLTFGPNPITPSAGGSASSQILISSSSYSATGTYTATITGSSGSLSHSTTLIVALTQTGYADFSISASPITLSVVQSTSGTISLTLTSVNGFNSPIGLSAAWGGTTPSGVTFTFPTLVSPPLGGSAAVTFTVTASSTASVGTFTVRVTGTSGFVRHSIDLVIQVSSSARDFTISLSPDSLSLVQGAQASSTVSVQSIGSFASGVTLTSSGAPSGMSVTVVSNPVTPAAGGTASSTLTISTSASIPVGSYGITIAGSTGSLSHSATLTVVVTPVAIADFSVLSSSGTISVTPGSSGAATITVQSRNGFSSAVLLFASWLSAAPEGTTFSLPTPITPMPNATATSILRVTAGSSATLGNYTLRVLGVSGSLTHFVDVTVKITSQQCVIATATYGSDLSPEVQFLRNFRDSMILKTYAGSNFMTVFNAWYYSFSPRVAEFITQHQTLKTLMKSDLYPLIVILRIGATAFSALQANPEIAAIVSGLVVTWLIGAVYLALPFSALLGRTPKGRRIARRLERPSMIVVLGTMSAIFITELTGGGVDMMILTSALVLVNLMLSTLLTSRLMMSLYSVLDRRRFA